MATTSKTEFHGNLIGGERRAAAAGDEYERRNPADPQNATGRFASSGPADVDAAEAALPGWAATPAPVRGRFLAAAARALEARVEQVAQDKTREMGKPIREARGEAARGSQTAGAEVRVPFGGTKGSGFGPHEQGRAALEFYTDVVTVYHDV